MKLCWVREIGLKKSKGGIGCGGVSGLFSGLARSLKRRGSAALHIGGCWTRDREGRIDWVVLS